MSVHRIAVPVALACLGCATAFAGLGANGSAGSSVQSAESAAPASGSPKTALGAIVGIVTDSAKQPVAHATVTAVRADGGGIRATVSGSDGVYSFGDLPPGSWALTIEAAGYPALDLPALEVLGSKATRRDVVMNLPSGAPAPSPAPALAALPKVVTPTVPLALQSPEPGPEVDTQTPFAVGDLGWMNGTSREKAPIFDTKFFTPEIRLDVNYLQDFNHPVDHTIVGSTEEFRSGEFQIEQVSLGGDFHWENVRARFLSMFGLFAVTTPRNDASAGVGQWDLQGAYKYFSEANAGYHFDVNHGLNVDARHLRLLHRSFQLLQLRQLDLPAVVCIVQHTVVLQRPARAVVPDADAEDRTLAHQWLAVVRQVQQPSGLRRTDPVDPKRCLQAGA